MVLSFPQEIKNYPYAQYEPKLASMVINQHYDESIRTLDRLSYFGNSVLSNRTIIIETLKNISKNNV